MNNLANWISQNAQGVQLVANIVVGLVGVIFIAILLIKAIRALGNEDMKTASKAFVYAILVVFVAFLSIKGIEALLRAMAPEGFEYGNNSLPGSAPDLIGETVNRIDHVITNF